MASAMLDVVNDLSMLDGTKVKIRIGECLQHSQHCRCSLLFASVP